MAVIGSELLLRSDNKLGLYCSYIYTIVAAILSFKCSPTLTYFDKYFYMYSGGKQLSSLENWWQNIPGVFLLCAMAQVNFGI